MSAPRFRLNLPDRTPRDNGGPFMEWPPQIDVVPDRPWWRTVESPALGVIERLLRTDGVVVEVPAQPLISDGGMPAAEWVPWFKVQTAVRLNRYAPLLDAHDRARK